MAKAKAETKKVNTGKIGKQNQITETSKKGKTLGAQHASHGDSGKGK